MKYRLVVLICIGAFFLSKVCQYFKLYPTDSMFYAVNASWSLLIIISVLCVERSKLTFFIALVSIGHILLNLLTSCEYMMLNRPYGFMYANYPVILHSLNIAELLVLILGAPGARMDRTSTKHHRVFLHKRSANSRNQSHI